MVVHGVRRSKDFYRDIDMHGKNILNAGNVGINISELMKGVNKNVTNEGILVEGFETIGDWTVRGEGATQEVVTGKVGNALKLNATGGNVADTTKTISQDFSAVTNFIWWVYVEDISVWKKVGIYMSSTTNFSKFFAIGLLVSNFHNGWNRICIDKSKFSNSGEEDWANIMIRLRIVNTPEVGENAYIIVDDLRKDYTARPKVIITFDDGWQSVYDKAYPIMAANGQKGVAFIITNLIGGAGRLTLANLNTLYGIGWDILNHTHTHQHLPAIPETQMHTEIDNATAWLINNGFKSSSLFLAYPYGAYNQTVIDYLKLKGFVFAKSTRNASWQPQLNLSDDLPYQICVLTCNNVTSTGLVQEYIDRAINQSGLLVLSFHKIVDADADESTKYLTADFQIISDYLKTKSDANLLDVETFTNYMWEFLY